MAAVLVVILAPPAAALSYTDTGCSVGGVAYCVSLDVTDVVATCAFPDGRFDCILEGVITVTAWSLQGLPGTATLTGWIELAVCGTPGPCDQTVVEPTGSCTFEADSSCTVQYPFGLAATGDVVDDCLAPYAEIDVSGHARTPLDAGILQADAHVRAFPMGGTAYCFT